MEEPAQLDVVRDQSFIPKCECAVLSVKIAATHLVVDQAPLLKECMNAHDGAHVSSQIPPACGDCEIFRRSEPVRVDHEIAVVFVNGGCFGTISRVEELRQGASFDGMDFGHVEPGRVRGYNDFVCLCCQVLAGLFFESQASCF